MKNLLLAILSIALLTFCKTTQKGDAAPSAETSGITLEGTRWKLIELKGKPVTADQVQKEPYLQFDAKEKRFSATGGCNQMSGAYEVNPQTLRISFGKVASTMMACEKGMDTDAALAEVLEMADNFTINGSTLSINKARMAPLARFEATGK